MSVSDAKKPSSREELVVVLTEAPKRQLIGATSQGENRQFPEQPKCLAYIEILFTRG